MLLSNYSYLYEIQNLIKTALVSPNVLSKPIDTFNIRLIGSRLSAKTMQALKWMIELGYQRDYIISTDIWRNEVSGANETFEELIGALEDIYEIESTRINTNSTKRRLKLPNNTINVNGFLSNRKNKTPKLGKARKGVKKQVQINFFEEASEFEDEKKIHMIKQATGGAKFIINIYIANPWVLSNWYVKIVNKMLAFNEKKLREHGEQIKQVYDSKKREVNITHITNHRINTYLEPAQHQMLYDAWDISEQFARVVDLGMPGVAEGLVYAPIIHMIGQSVRNMPIEEFRGGIDWGTSTSSNGSATTMILGKIGRDYSQIALDEEYYHSNATQHYKNDDTLVSELVEQLIRYTKANRDKIQQSTTGHIKVFYDYGAAMLGSALKKELALYTKERLIVDLILIKPCSKFEVPTRIDIVKHLISSGRYKINKELMPNHYEELENCQWEETRMVSGRPTRENTADHTLDAMEYMIGDKLLKMAKGSYLQMNKVLNQNFATGYQ